MVLRTPRELSPKTATFPAMSYDVLCAGELLVDLISTDATADVSAATTFAPVPGGSPANLATNLRHLGVDAQLVAAVGDDAFGDLLQAHLDSCGLSREHVRTIPATPTTVVTVTRSVASPSYEVYRGADPQVEWSQFEPFVQAPPRIFHTTCFALSGLPARSHLLRASRVLAKAGTILSIDANYAEKVWPDRARARRVVADYIAQGALVKMSDDDWLRLHGETLTPDIAEARGRALLHAGARQVCFTFGSAGAVLVTSAGVVRLSPKPVDVVDSTGAGDSFWSGFLAAYLAGESPERCLETGINVAAVKLQRVGTLAAPLDWRAL